MKEGERNEGKERDRKEERERTREDEEYLRWEKASEKKRRVRKK